jgi:hypothetical protein
MLWNGSSPPPNYVERRGFEKRKVTARRRKPLDSIEPRRNSLHVEQKLERLTRMRVPMKARSSVSLKTLIAGLGVALLSACSGGPTAPTAAPSVQGRASLAPVARSNSGYVVAERDSVGATANGLTNVMGTLAPKFPPVGLLPIDQ